MATGSVIVGSYAPYTVATDGAVVVGTFGLGVLPNYNTSLISVISRVTQNMSFPQFVMGGRGGSGGTTYSLFKKTSTYGLVIFRSPVYNVGQEFDVMQIRLNLLSSFSAGTSIIPKLYFDNERDSVLGTTIDSSTFSSQLITLTPKDFSNTTHGYSNFFLELQISGSSLSVVSLPIFVDVEIYEK